MGEMSGGPKSHDVLKLAKAFIRLPKLDVDINQSFKVTDEFLRSLPKSKYRDQQSDQSSDDTEIYWSLNVSSDEDTPERPPKCMIHAHPSWRSVNFSFSIHGIRRVKPHYNLHCDVKNCKEKFATVKAWNGHYHLCHHILLKCSTCGKSFHTPSSYRDHKYSHHKRKYTCTVCDKCFMFKCGMQIHRCVQFHTSGVRTCITTYSAICQLSIAASSVSHQHQIIHSSHYKYCCPKYLECPFRSKYYTSNAHHQNRCKFQ